jgi:hypothetical protein
LLPSCKSHNNNEAATTKGSKRKPHALCCAMENPASHHSLRSGKVVPLAITSAKMYSWWRNIPEMNEGCFVGAEEGYC